MQAIYTGDNWHRGPHKKSHMTCIMVYWQKDASCILAYFMMFLMSWWLDWISVPYIPIHHNEIDQWKLLHQPHNGVAYHCRKLVVRDGSARRRCLGYGYVIAPYIIFATYRTNLLLNGRPFDVKVFMVLTTDLWRPYIDYVPGPLPLCDKHAILYFIFGTEADLWSKIKQTVDYKFTWYTIIETSKDPND